VLSLVSGQEVKDVIFRMVRAGVITGKVVDEAGEPMLGAAISVLRKPSEEEVEDEEPGTKKKYQLVPAGAGATDDRGAYRVFGLKPGDYYVKAIENSGRAVPGALIHGDDDRNVPFHESVLLVEALRKQGVPFDQLIFPDEIHGFLTRKRWIEAYQAAADFVGKYLKP